MASCGQPGIYRTAHRDELEIDRIVAPEPVELQSARELADAGEDPGGRVGADHSTGFRRDVHQMFTCDHQTTLTAGRGSPRTDPFPRNDPRLTSYRRGLRDSPASHEPNNQTTTDHHGPRLCERPVPDIQIEKPAVGRHEFELHARPLWNLLPAHCSAYCVVPLLPA
jgi:hypothetical protein